MDAFLSGKIMDGWYGSIGGFYRVSDGVRDPQYPSDIGGQLTATLKHDLDGGSIMFWYRILQDKNQWVADFPYVVSNGKVSAVSRLQSAQLHVQQQATAEFPDTEPRRRLSK